MALKLEFTFRPCVIIVSSVILRLSGSRDVHTVERVPDAPSLSSYPRHSFTLHAAPICPSNMIPLPLSIVLLIHIHLLQYPHANSPEYDDHVFDPKTRGLKDRMKTMEDLTYFLVGKVEGKSALRSVGTILVNTFYR